jgi:deoxyinosine 3'endonuclease (endonuclease V)
MELNEPTPPPPTTIWLDEQFRIRQQIIETDDESMQPLTYIGGVDISFVKGTNKALSAFIVMAFPSFIIVHQDYRIVEMTKPYISGFLAFREVEHLKILVDHLKLTKPEIFPQIIMVDGNGVLHPRRCGLASHLGVVCDVPTIGIGKNLLHVDGLDKTVVDTWKAETQLEDLSNVRTLSLVGSSGQTFGVALCMPQRTKPIFVSVGHRLSLSTCLEVTVRCSKFRIPAPVRAADLGSREVLRGMKDAT